MSNMTERKGIMLAGNILTDTVKMIPTFPEQGMLVTVSDIVRVGRRRLRAFKRQEDKCFGIPKARSKACAKA